MLEIPGSQRGEKADRLAECLREVLADVARVERPVKCADLYIRDLDNSVTVEEVMTAVAAKGGSSAHQIKPGQILGRGNSST
ncbi:unnamed protein product [Pieris macdunnoughi]|uniref:Uncharacterized protein n=1 Tax=Pieris macdunnoughi TaxID=345717 RepID=A0A821UIY8_9NEOP|nr:unnamed protein product [Pieris macdunnoughi]